MLSFVPGSYFTFINMWAETEGLYKVLSTHVAGKTVTYRPARWYEKLWTKLTQKKVPTFFRA